MCNVGICYVRIKDGPSEKGRPGRAWEDLNNLGHGQVVNVQEEVWEETHRTTVHS